MNEEDLESALEPVREHFSGKEVNANTVLAAYLRADGLPASGQPWQRAKKALAGGASFIEAVAQGAVEPDDSTIYEPVPASDIPTPFEGDRLGWFPKQFGPGDIDGVGAKRLLGTPDLEPAWVLVRETAQNSWDARGTAESIDFSLNLRLLDHATVEVLRDQVFTGEATKTGIPDLLRQEQVWALEIRDRGSVGLGGPIRNDLAVDPGEDTNFIDLVFNIGAPRDVHLGAGTYGFGKTISYVVSSVGAILIWSRCEGAHGREQRLIGSAIGDGFDMDGYRYTGRHWWGNVVHGEDRIEPVIGDVAETLGSKVFASGFDADDTGTSILILDPILGGETSAEDLQMLVDATVWNLWPKLIGDQEERSRMRIRIQHNGEDIALPDVDDHEALSGHADCLRAVRAVQAGQDVSTLGLRSPVVVDEVRSERPRKLLGHIGLTRYPVPRGTEKPSRWVTLMRSQAELVVSYLERAPLDVDGFQWAGVFKPVAEVDDSFALSEPPAHDDWIPKAVADKAQRRDVNVALTRIERLTSAFVSPHSAEQVSEEPVRSAAIAGDALAGLLGGIAGSAPERRTFERTGGKRAARPTISVVGAETTDGSAAGWSRTGLEIQLTGSGSSVTPVDVTVKVGIDGGSEDGREVIRVLGWLDAASGHHEAGQMDFTVGEVRRFEFESRADLAIDVDAKVVDR